MISSHQLVQGKNVPKSHELFAEAQAIAKMGHWELDMKSQQLLWSDHQYRIYGYEPGELELSDEFFFLKTTHPSDIRRVKETIDVAIRNGDGYNFDRKIIRKDGSLGYAQTIAKVIRSKGGVVSRIIGITQDISERKNTELLLSTVLNSSMSGIEAFGAVRNEKGKIIDFKFLLVNSISETLRGKLAGSLTGKLMSEMDPFNFRPQLFEKFVAVVDQCSPISTEHSFDSGKWILGIHAVPLDDGFVLTYQDITEKRMLEIQSAELQIRQQEEIVKAIMTTREEERKRVAEALHISFTQLLNLNNYNRSDLGLLSKREIEILTYIAEGFTNSEIAEKTFTSKRTIDTHRKNILDKTGSQNTASLIKYAILNGIIKI